MRIAYLLNQYPMPSQTFIRREIAALEASGLPVRRVTVRRAEGDLPDPLDREELDRTEVILDGPARLALAVLRTMVTRPRHFLEGLRLALRLGWRGARGVPIHLVYLAEACVALHWFRATDVTHVHSHFGTNATAVAAICRAMGGPRYSFTIHGPEEFDRPEALKLSAKVEGAAFVAAISDHGRSQIYRWCPHARWDRVHVVRCGLDGAFLEAEASPVADVRRLVNVGRLEEQKGQMLLVEAVGLAVERGVDVEVLIIGDGSMRPELTRLIEASGLADRVTLAGWMSNLEVREAIVASRATILASFAEGLPVAIMESFALGRPVVTTHVAGIPELVAPGDNGWLVPPGSVEALADAIAAVETTGPSELTAMGERGRLAVRERHDVRREAARLAELIRDAHRSEQR